MPAQPSTPANSGREPGRDAAQPAAPALGGVLARLGAVREEIAAQFQAVREEAGPLLADVGRDLADRVNALIDWIGERAEDAADATAAAGARGSAQPATGPGAAESAALIARALRTSADRLEATGTRKTGRLDHLDRLTEDARGRLVALVPDQLRLSAALIERLVVDGRIQESV